MGKGTTITGGGLSLISGSISGGLSLTSHSQAGGMISLTGSAMGGLLALGGSGVDLYASKKEQGISEREKTEQESRKDLEIKKSEEVSGKLARDFDRLKNY